MGKLLRQMTANGLNSAKSLPKNIMPNIKVYINTSYKKINGGCAIYLRVSFDYETLKFNTGVCCNPDLFDKQNLRITGTSQKVADDNLIIEKCLAQMNEIFVRYRLQNIQLTPDLLKNEWRNPSRRIDFFAFFDEALKERKFDIANQTYKNQKTAISKLKEFRGSLAFSEITPEFIEQYRRWLKTKKKNDINTIYSDFKNLKAYMNIAVRKGVIAASPFAGIKIKKAKTDRIYLTKTELSALYDLYKSVKLTTDKQKVLRHFLFMCFTGVRVSDLKALTRGHVVGNMLIFNAFKTRSIKKILIKLPLNKFAMQLIADEGGAGERLFDTISEQKMNTYIKDIAKGVGIFKAVTNHSGRHTFATNWLEQTSDLATLKELLGHSNIQETMIYVHITDGHKKKQMDLFEGNLFK